MRAEVYVKYLDPNSSNWTAAMSSLITSIANGTAPTNTFVDGGSPGSTGGVTAPHLGALNKSGETGTAPKAYLNYIIFDRDYIIKDGGFVRVTTAAREYGQDGIHEKLSASITVSEPGYIYLYLSNDNVSLGGAQVEVYFDDFRIEHVKSPVVSSQDYYPFGLTFNSYSRENSLSNRYQYNSKEQQDELNLGWLDYGARMYMSDIGRWGAIDPLAEDYYSASPYHYVNNNPTNYIDPDGRSAEAVVNERKKEIKVKVTMIYYGSEANKKTAKAASKEIQSMWNNANAKVNVGGADYDVKFKVKTKVVSEKRAEKLAEKNGSSKNNFVRIESKESSGAGTPCALLHSPVPSKEHSFLANQAGFISGLSRECSMNQSVHPSHRC